MARLCLILAATSGALIVGAVTERATVRVSPQKVLGTVNPLVFGNNMLAYQGGRDEYSNRGSGIWDPEDRRPVPEYVELAKRAGITISRWPGGCGAHQYDWTKTVGPVQERPQMKFGLAEFLEATQAIGAQAVLTLAVYWGGPQQGADIVEYLNSPADGSNPNGGQDWAAVRAAQGHQEPFGVVYFEYGNESYHGTHTKPKVRVTAEQYARQYLEYRRAMKAVDPRVQLGALVQNGQWDWNATVLDLAGKEMDFAVEHTYVPGYRGNKGEVPARTIAEACLACDAQIQRTYDRLLAFIQEHTGREDLPLAITEYNGAFVQEKPVPYRQCLVNALRNAEHVRVLLRPRNRILMANFWQFANEYWGMVRGYVHRGETPVRQANYYVYQMYHEHFGETLVDVAVECGGWDFGGGVGVVARAGAPTEFRLFPENLLGPAKWELRSGTQVQQRLEGDVVVAEFPGPDLNYYHARIELPAEPNTGYRVTGWIKTENLQSARPAQFQVGDARGWVVTKSCRIGGDVSGTTDWTKVETDYVTLQDTKAIEIIARKLEGAPATGKAFYRIEKVQKFTPESAGAVPYVSATAAVRKADGMLTVMLVNKNLDGPTQTTILIEGQQGRAARAWSLVGPAPEATNLKDPDAIKIVNTPIEKAGDGWQVTLPACSLTAVEIAD